MAANARRLNWPLPVPLVMAVSGMLPLVLPEPIPESSLGFLILLTATGLATARTRRWCWLLVPPVWTCCVIHAQFADRLDDGRAGQSLAITGTVASLPQRHDRWLEFLFRPEPREDTALPKRIRVRWYEDTPTVHAGERWRLELRLQPPRGRVNFQGHDAERRHFARGIGALATVSGPYQGLGDGGRWTLDSLRQDVRQDLTRILADEPGMGLVIGLAIGDRSLMDREQWEHLSATGTGHLLAISGLHIGLAAVIGFRLGALLLLLLPHRWRLHGGLAPSWACAMLIAAGYAGMAGFGVSTRRALIMLGVLAATRLFRRKPGAWQSWSLALLGVVLLDPLSPLLPGFWMSFAAVAALLAWFGPRMGPQRPPVPLLSAQAALVLALLPLGMFWFQRASGLGLVANLFAIPVVSFIVVPLVLAGLGLVLMGWVGAASWALLPAAWSAEGLARALAWLATHGAAWTGSTPQPAWLNALLATLGALLLLTPAPLSLRSLALTLLLPGLLPVAGRLPAGSMRLELLDVGQGLAATVSTPSALLLYDTGPGLPGRWDLVGSVILPSLRASGHRKPDFIVVSHGDYDHAGGLAGLRSVFPDTTVMANHSGKMHGTIACHTPIAWTRPNLHVRVLHPSPGLPYLGNLSSCVLSVASEHHSVLLPGDIERVVEARLVRNGLGAHTVLVAPHHGSETSSGRAFIDAVNPDIVLVAAGAGNRFDFPRPGVINRYQEVGARVFSVSNCGALRVWLAKGIEPRLESARRERMGVWRWPPDPACP